MKEAQEISALLKEYNEIEDMWRKLERYINSQEEEMVKIEGDSGKLPILRLNLDWLRDALGLVKEYKLSPIKTRLEEQVKKMYFATDQDVRKKQDEPVKRRAPAMTTYD